MAGAFYSSRGEDVPIHNLVCIMIFFFRSRGVFSTLPLFFFPYKIVGYYCILVSFLHIVGLAWLGADCGFGSAVVFGFGFGFVYLLLVVLNQLLCILRCFRGGLRHGS